MPIFAVLQAAVGSYGGQPIWFGDPDNPKPFTITNLAATGNIWIGNTQAVGPSYINNSTPISPSGYLSFDGTEPVYYVIADAPGVTCVVYPGVQSVFQPGNVNFVTITNPPAEDASTPAVVHSVIGTSPSTTTAAFSPPANSTLVAEISVAHTSTPSLTVTNTGTALTWTGAVSITFGSSGSGVTSAIFIARNVSAQSGITVTAKNTDAANPSIILLALRVVNNASANQTGAATATTAAMRSNVSAAITPTQIGSLIYVCGAQQGNNTQTVLAGTTDNGSFSDGTNLDSLQVGKASANTSVLSSTTYGWSAGPSNGTACVALEILHS